jgi:hypothetical protein
MSQLMEYVVGTQGRTVSHCVSSALPMVKMASSDQ